MTAKAIAAALIAAILLAGCATTAEIQRNALAACADQYPPDTALREWCECSVRQQANPQTPNQCGEYCQAKYPGDEQWDEQSRRAALGLKI